MFHNVVALYGVPRSGTSWLGEIIDSCPEVVYRFQPLFSYRFKNRITTESTQEDMQYFFDELYLADDDEFLNQIDKRKNSAYPIFKEKAHNPSILAYKEARYAYTIPILLERFEEIKVIGIVRNPYDVLESWINAPSEYKPEWDIYEEWNLATKKNEYRPENYFGYYKWKEFLKLNLDMQNLYPHKFKSVRYEDLEENAEDVAQELFEFAGIPYTVQTKEFIRESQSVTTEGVYAVYRKKGQKRMKKYYLPEDIKRIITLDLQDFYAAQVYGYVKKMNPAVEGGNHS